MMKKFRNLQKIKKIFEEGQNIIKYLKKKEGRKSNRLDDILISYDFQSGQYLKNLLSNIDFKLNYCQSLANRINKFDKCDSILEVGIGEATTFGLLKKKLSNNFKFYGGFDISWSRLSYAQHFLKDIGIKNFRLFCADLFQIPLFDNSIDIVYTSHSLEPNGGREEQAILELMRITSKYLVLLEPIYELENESVQKRMDEHGYIKGLYEIIIKNGFKILEYKKFEYSQNRQNPTSIIVIEKVQDIKKNKIDFMCPISKKQLKIYDNLLYSKEGCLSYPIISKIPCLVKENAILTSHYDRSFNKFKSNIGIGDFNSLIYPPVK